MIVDSMHQTPKEYFYYIYHTYIYDIKYVTKLLEESLMGRKTRDRNSLTNKRVMKWHMVQV